MTPYLLLVGTIEEIDYLPEGMSRIPGCMILYTLRTEDQGTVHVLLPAGAYVLNLRPLEIGDRATFFAPANAPMPLIYPPRYQAAAAAYTPNGVTAVLDVFDQELTNSEGTLTLTPDRNTLITLPNGQPFAGALEGRLMMILYTASTRSIPARTTPEQIIVFCVRT